jgi:hypothetical protein
MVLPFPIVILKGDGRSGSEDREGNKKGSAA